MRISCRRVYAAEHEATMIRLRGSRGRPMSATTTYYALSAEQLRAAQATLDEHVTSSATGRCLACGSPGPCWRRENAVVIFSRTLRLPARRPGASRPELINAVRVPIRQSRRRVPGDSS